MATLTKEQTDYFNKEIGKIQEGINKLKSEQGTAPSATQYGASGRGEVQLTEKQSQQIADAGGSGVAASEYGNYLENPSAYKGVSQTLDKNSAAGISKEFGLSGLGVDDQFIGLSKSEARRKAQEIKDGKLATTSALTSYAFNPQTISGFSEKMNDMKFKVDSNNNDPWVSSQEKQAKNQAIVSSFSDQLAGLFNTPEEFNSAMQNPEFQKTLQQYQSFGGNPMDIASRIQDPNNPNTPSQRTQTLEQYLGALATPEEKKAYESLIPEKQVYQDQIMFEQSIPQQYRDLYFGTPEQVGLVEQRRIQAEEEAKLIERQAKADEKNARAQVEFAKEQNRAQMEVESARIEENRLAAKNYMTGALAKLGALKTTGAAPQALATLEQKYQQQSQQMRMAFDFKNKEMELRLNEEVDNLILSRDRNILKIKSDLSKSEEEVINEIFKLQNSADRETFRIAGAYTQKFRTERERYVREAKAEAEKYAKELAKTIGEKEYDISGLSFGEFIKAEQNKRQQTLMPEAREGLVPDFLQTLINSGEISSMLENVVSGEKSIADYSTANQAKIRKEMSKLGLTNEMVKSATKESKAQLPSVGNLLSEARAAIDEGKDPVAVRRRFLEAYPEKSAAWNAYFND
jgi:hypothetical protein